MSHRFRDVLRFLTVEHDRRTLADRAEAAMASADVAAQHERRRAIGPALKNVRALRFLADRVQIQTLDQLEQMILVRRIAELDTQPFRLRLARFLIEYSKFAGHV